MSVEENLEKLSLLIKKSKDVELVEAFANFLLSLNTSMGTYLMFLSSVKESVPEEKEEEQVTSWDVTLKQKEVKNNS